MPNEFIPLTEEEKQSHPARYALVEAVNIHDEGIVFSPIYRVMYNANKTQLICYPSGKMPESAEFTVPETVTRIANGAFLNCRLKSVTVAETVSRIGDKAFYDNNKLTSITIPERVKIIGTDAFANCLPSLKIYGYDPSEAKTYAEDNNITFIDSFYRIFFLYIDGNE